MVGRKERSMKLIAATALALAVNFAVLPTLAEARCDTANDIARDGSRCGSRAADQRSGGR